MVVLMLCINRTLKKATPNGQGKANNSFFRANDVRLTSECEKLRLLHTYPNNCISSCFPTIRYTSLYCSPFVLLRCVSSLFPLVFMATNKPME